MRAIKIFLLLLFVFGVCILFEDMAIKTIISLFGQEVGRNGDVKATAAAIFIVGTFLVTMLSFAGWEKYQLEKKQKAKFFD